MSGDLRVRVLGGFAVEGISEQKLGSRKARLLLKVLALARGAPVTPDRLADVLWGDALPSRPHDQVAVLVSRLRRVLGTDRITRSDAGYCLVVDWLDLDAAAELTAEADRRLQAGAIAGARAAAQAAVAHWRGPLLPEEAGSEWLAADAGGAQRLYRRTLLGAGRVALAGGDHTLAAELASRGLQEDPLDEEMLRLLMVAEFDAGRPGTALQAYEAMRSRLTQELGADPHADTQAVHASILREERPAGFPVRGALVGDASAGAPTAGQGGSSGGAAPSPPAVTAGRERELAALDAAFEEVAASGSARIVLVQGEAGIGKTKLATEWASRARARGLTVAVATCDATGLALPLQPVADAIHAALRTLDDEQARRVLGDDLEIVGPLLGRAGAPPPAVTDPVTGRALVFASLLAVLMRLGDRPGDPARPPHPAGVALVLDDLHLAGESTLEWVQFAQRRGNGVLLVGTVRTGSLPALAGTRIGLGPLDLQAAVALVGAERAPELHERSGGHPMMMVELAAAGPGQIPASITEAVTARCDQLGAAATTLRTAAVIGQSVDLELLGAVLRLPPGDLLEHLDDGVRHGFLDDGAAGLAFRHELVRDALADAAGTARRAFVHRECGRVLAARPGADPLAVAFHCRLGQDLPTAAEAYLRAAELAESRYALDESIRLVGEAIALHDTAEARLRRARGLTVAARYDEAAVDASQALSLGGGAPALEAAGWIAYYRRDFPGARRLAEDGVRLGDDPDIRASCLTLAARVRQGDGDLHGAEAQLEEAARIAGPAVRPVAWTYLSLLRIQQGRIEEGLELARPVAASAAGSPTLRLYAQQSLAHALVARGRIEEALAATAAFEELSKRLDLPRFFPRVHNYRGGILRLAGAVKSGDEENRAALELASEAGLPEPHAYALLDLADGRMLAGDLDAAWDLLARVEPVQQIEHVNAWRHEFKARLLRARLALASGVFDEAWVGALSLEQDAAELGVQRYVAAAALVGEVGRVRAGEPGDTERALEFARALGGLAIGDAVWLSADLAAATGLRAFLDVAAGHLETLMQHAGPFRDDVVRWAGARLDAAGRSPS